MEEATVEVRMREIGTLTCKQCDATTLFKNDRDVRLLEHMFYAGRKYFYCPKCECFQEHEIVFWQRNMVEKLEKLAKRRG